MPDFVSDLIADTPLAALTGWHLMGIALLIYLLATARSAWKQGEFLQFLRSLVIVAALVVGLLAFAQAWIWIDRHW